ncbi:hypothetical protein [Nocardioides zeicaulis]|uniref:FlgD Ig-like domain-containing protein n=1 Tax=Nocardioides zeicaulis TaxID=1776857 RepID=A0ABV6E1Q1_9ACTN
MPRRLHLAATAHSFTDRAGDCNGAASVTYVRLIARAVASLLAVAIVVGLSQQAGAELDEPAAVDVSVAPTEFWPAPEDGGEQLTVTFTAPVAGTYEIRVEGTIDGTYHDFGTLQPGTYSWTWDGRDRRGNLLEEQSFNLKIYSWRDNNHWADDVVVPIKLSRSGDSTYITDNNGDEGSAGHLDLDRFTLTTDRAGVHARYDFLPGYRKSNLFAAQAYLDVDQLKPGYIASIRRKTQSPKSKLVLTLTMAQLYSDAGGVKTIRCRGMKAEHEKRALAVTVPRRCMRLGGDKVRAGAFISDIHNHFDGFPDYGDGYRWTDWVRYEPRP